MNSITPSGPKVHFFSEYIDLVVSIVSLQGYKRYSSKNFGETGT